MLHKTLKQLCLIATALFIIGQPLVDVFNTYLDKDYEICDSTEEKEDKSKEINLILEGNSEDLDFSYEDWLFIRTESQVKITLN